MVCSQALGNSSKLATPRLRQSELQAKAFARVGQKTLNSSQYAYAGSLAPSPCRCYLHNLRGKPVSAPAAKQVIGWYP
jgi:hypothetical protein